TLFVRTVHNPNNIFLLGKNELSVKNYAWATVRMPAASAPLVKTVRASSKLVDPVVKTSSTMTTVLFLIADISSTLKASTIFCRRFLRLNPVCVRVFLDRTTLFKLQISRSGQAS